MSREIRLPEKYSKTFVKREAAVNAAEKYDCRFIVVLTESGRYMPIMVGQDAVASGAVHSNIMVIG